MRKLGGIGTLAVISELSHRLWEKESREKVEAGAGGESAEGGQSPAEAFGAQDSGVIEKAMRKARAGRNLTREEAAQIISVSTKKIQRMEAARTLVRCPGLGTVVRYAARDVLRLAGLG